MADTTLNFEHIYQILREVSEKQREAAEIRKETEHIMKQSAIDAEKRFQELDQLIKQNAIAAEKRSQEINQQMQETDRRMQETDRQMQETDKKLEKLSKNVGGLNSSMGELIETLIASRLWEKFAGYPYNLKRSYRRIPVYDNKHKALTDIDILLSDGQWVMAMEVKREPDKDDIDHHIRRMDLIRKFPPAETLNKKLLGAIAGGVVEPHIKDYAHKAGFFILELSGESVSLVSPPDNFSPKIW
jgi:hypothetical protein